MVCIIAVVVVVVSLLIYSTIRICFFLFFPFHIFLFLLTNNPNSLPLIWALLYSFQYEIQCGCVYWKWEQTYVVEKMFVYTSNEIFLYKMTTFCLMVLALHEINGKRNRKSHPYPKTTGKQKQKNKKHAKSNRDSLSKIQSYFYFNWYSIFNIKNVVIHFKWGWLSTPQSKKNTTNTWPYFKYF